MEGILLCCFLIEVVKYWLGLRMCFSVEIQRKWVAAAGGALYLLWVLFAPWKDDTYVIMNSILLTVLLLTVIEPWREKLKKILLLFFVFSCIDSIFAGIISVVLEVRSENTFAEIWQDGLSSFITLVILIVFSLWNKRKHILEKENIIRFIRKGMIFFVVFMVIDMMLTISGLSFAGEYVPNANFKLFANVISTAAYFAVGMLGAFLIYIKNMNEKLEKSMETERALKKLQEKYYETLLEKEEGTRRYRHDMNNHFLCLEELAKEGDTKAVSDYINSMQEQITVLQKKSFVTGNKVLDVLLNHYGSAVDEDTSVSLSGKLNTVLEISDVDLCTIFANLLQNAVEAVETCQNSEKYIQVQIEQGKEYLKIRIENSAEVVKDKKDMLRTRKKDKRNHGIGIQNVKKTIERNHGMLQINREETKFAAEVVLKNHTA
ncbi:MAG: GHKL domain-containing protein [Lachnospiraceae bacterium]|nr:GHKL domain-containing protein [Lachnospiraceae bacterium]